MKILFVVDNYMGGAGNIIQLLATEYAKKDEVCVILTHKTIEKRYECPGVKFIELDAKDKPSGIKAFAFQVRWIKQRVKEEKPDIIISFITINSIMLCLGQLRTNIPIIACERNDPFVDVWKFPWRNFLKWSYKRADLITVQFEHFKKMHNGVYEKKCKVTPNYIATPECYKNLNIRNKKTRFVSCGRLNTQKQFDILIEMFAEIHKKNPDTELRIYGYGPCKEELNRKINQLGMSDSIELAGYATDVYDVLCNSDIYLMSSKYEGFPNALSEAMAVGLPSISFRCHAGIDELCDYGRRGAVVPLNDKEAFVKMALEICHDYNKYEEYSKNAKEVCKVYSMERIKAIWDECIKIAIEKRRKKK